MGWVTRSFDEWRLNDMDLRGFLQVSLKVADETYSRWWEEILHQPGDPDVEAIDVWEDRAHGIHMHDYEWMLLSGGLVSAVTALEVYLEKAIEEVLRRHGHTLKPSTEQGALHYDDSVEFFNKALGCQLKGHQDLRDVRDLRHILVHKRGELRTESDRKRFDPVGDRWLHEAVQLDLNSTMARMDTLGKHARRADAAAYGLAWGDEPPDALRAYIADHEI